jgi:truncated hemoglobin YjbI
MDHRKEIETREDIGLLVERFYEKVKEDDLIGDIFNNELFFSVGYPHARHDRLLGNGFAGSIT